MGEVSTANLHPLTGLDVEPIADQTPELVVAATHVPASVLAAPSARPIWWNDQVVVYAVGASLVPLMPPPAARQQRAVLEDVVIHNDLIDFSATFVNPTSEHWTSQDWVVLDADASLWELLRSLESGRGTGWFGGQIDPKPGTTTFDYRFDATAGQLAIRSADGTLAHVPRSGRGPSSGTWLLTMRLRDNHRVAHLFPLLTFETLPDGSVRYEAGGVISSSPQAS